MYFPASMSLLSDYHGPETRSRAMSVHQSSVYAGTIAGGTLAGYMAQYHGWRSSFYVFGWLGIVLAIVLLAALKEPPRSQASSPKTAMKPVSTGLFSHPMSIVLVAVFVGANFVASVFLTWLPSFLNRKFGMTLAMAGFSSTAYLQAASVLGVLSGGFLADRLARRHRGGRMITQAAGLLLGVPFLFLTGWTMSTVVLVLAMTGFGYFKGFYDANIWASLYDVVPVTRRATAVGLMNSIGWLGRRDGSGRYRCALGSLRDERLDQCHLSHLSSVRLPDVDRCSRMDAGQTGDASDLRALAAESATHLLRACIPGGREVGSVYLAKIRSCEV